MPHPGVGWGSKDFLDAAGTQGLRVPTLDYRQIDSTNPEPLRARPVKRLFGSKLSHLGLLLKTPVVHGQHASPRHKRCQ